VPLILRGPGIAAGQVERKPVSLVDIASFLLEGGKGVLSSPERRPLLRVLLGNLHFGWAPLSRHPRGSMKLHLRPAPRALRSRLRSREAETCRRTERMSPEAGSEIQKLGEKKPRRSRLSRGSNTREPRLRRAAVEQGDRRGPHDEIAISDFGRKLRRHHPLRARRLSIGAASLRRARRRGTSFSSRSTPTSPTLPARLTESSPRRSASMRPAAVIYDGYSILHPSTGERSSRQESRGAPPPSKKPRAAPSRRPKPASRPQRESSATGPAPLPLSAAPSLSTRKKPTPGTSSALFSFKETKSTPPSRHSSARFLSGRRTRCSAAIWSSRVVHETAASSSWHNAGP
jgi:hypothetical protein